MIVVSDTTAISNLIQIDALYLLQSLYDKVSIPTAVYNELLVLEQRNINITEKLNQDWLVVSEVLENHTYRDLSIELDIGEVQAILLAINENADYLLIDEKKGRRIAAEKGIPIIGTLGVLIEARRRGIIASVQSKMDDLIRIGFWINTKLYNRIINIEKDL